MAQTDIVSGIFTKKVTNSSWTVLSSYAFTQLSFILTSGSATITGGVVAAGEASAAIDLVVNIPFTITADSNYPISGIVLTASAGIVQICGKK